MVLSKDDKKAIKSQRVKDAFAQTAKDIIEQSGVQAVSVRKVAEQSGYSLRTIYNYFTNLDELLWHTRDLMLADIAEYFMNQNGEIKNDDDLKKIFRLFMDYFIQNPNVFFFFYCYPLDKSVTRSNKKIMNEPQVQAKFAQTFQYMMQRGGYSMEAVGKATYTIIYALYGMLTLYLSGNDELTLDAIYKQLDDIVELMIN
ncbi:MAG: TetR/AcrR family transcriptional regulator [Eubacteriales bacterium]